MHHCNNLLVSAIICPRDEPRLSNHSEIIKIIPSTGEVQLIGFSSVLMILLSLLGTHQIIDKLRSLLNIKNDHICNIHVTAVDSI